MPLYCILAGHNKEACYYSEKLAEQLKKSGEVDLRASLAIGYSYWQAGKTKEAEYYFNRQIEIDLESIRLGRLNTINRRAHFDLALVYAFKGDKEKAYRYLDEVNKNQAFPLWWVIQFKYNPLLCHIRQEPRFQKILKDVEAKYQAEHERVGKWMVSQGLM
jgi:tetratricopeptide (TPR) repeat protein